MKRPRKVVVGHWQDAEVQDRLAAWQRAAAGLHEMRCLKVARFGDNMRQVAVTEGDKVEAQIRSAWKSTGTAWASWPDASRRDRCGDRPPRRRIRPTVHDGLIVAARRPTSPVTAIRRTTELGLRAFLDDGASGPSPIRLKTSPGSNNSPASRRSGSWPTVSASAPRAIGRRPLWAG